MSESARARLSPRAREVARLIALGLTNRQIAQHLFLSERTVEWHVDQILNRLGFSTRSQVAAWVGRTEHAVALRRPGPQVRSNLPAPLTNFVGRQRDLATVRRLMSTSRLVTVIGPGGIGKTRLALRLAEELEPSTADGVWLGELATAQNVGFAVDSIAETLGVDRSFGDVLGGVRDHLRERNLLLVLDTCEHLLPQLATVVEGLLRACHGLQVLATSRAPLGITGEAVWRLGPLVPVDAVRLFTERAREAAPEFDADAASGAIEELCERLGGVPLALELAASRLRVRSLSEISDTVLDPQSMAHVAGWSYRLLGPSAQRVFRAVSVFVRWFDAEDAAAILPEAADLRPLMGELVESSMLIRESRNGARDRYRMLEVLRPFAQRLLAESGEARDFQVAHAERMVELAERLDLRRDDAPSDAWQKVAGMVEDVRVAMDTLLQARPQRAAWLASLLLGMWYDTGRLEEGLRWTEAALRAYPDRSDERCSLLYAKSLLLYWLGRPEPADRALQDAVALTASSESDAIRGELLLRAALVHSCREEWALSEAAQRGAVEVFTAAGREQNAARALNHLALSLLYQGRITEARDLAHRSLEMRRLSGKRIEPALDTFAQACALLGDLDLAERCWLEAGAIVLAEGDLTGTAYALRGLAYVCASRGRRDDALRLHYCAEQLSMGGAPYHQPLGPALRKTVNRLQSATGKDRIARLRAEGAALTPEGALRLVAR